MNWIARDLPNHARPVISTPEPAVLRHTAPGLSFYLLIYLAVAVLPLALFIIWIAIQAIDTTKVSLQDEAHLKLMRVARRVNATLHAATAQIEALAATPAIDRGDVQKFYARAIPATTDKPFALLLEDSSGNVLADSRVSSPNTGVPVASRSPDLEKSWHPVRNLATGDIEITSSRPAAAGSEGYRVRAIFAPESLGNVLRSLDLGPDYYSSIIDASGVIMARSTGSRELIGKPLPAFDPKLAGQPILLKNPEGVPVVGFMESLEASGVFVSIGISQAKLLTPVSSMLTQLLLLAAIVLAVTVAATTAIRRRLVSAFEQLAEFARMGGAGPRDAPRTVIAEANFLGNFLADVLNRLNFQNLELEASKENLERIVQERTERLNEQANQLSESNARFSAALANMSQGLALFDDEQRLLVANDRYREIYKLSPGDIRPGTTLQDILIAAAHKGMRQEMTPSEYVRTTNKPRSNVAEIFDGVHVLVSRQPMQAGGWVTTHQDISGIKRIETDLRHTKAFLDIIIDRMPAAVCVKDIRKGRYYLVNRAYGAMVGKTRSEVLGTTVHDILPKERARIVREMDILAIAQPGVPVSNETTVTRVDGTTGILASTRLTVADDGIPTMLITLIDDVTEHRIALRNASYLASHDSLTGLKNRASFREGLVALQHENHAVFFIDLDSFKVVNDTLGHKAGDDLLIAAARRIEKALGRNEFVARIGGDEFGIIQIEDDDPLAAAERLAAKLIEICKEPVEIFGSQINLTCSIGIAMAPEDGVTPDDLLMRADLALYATKSNGRNGYTIYTAELGSAAIQKEELANGLRRAIAERELEVHYQPIVDSQTLRIHSFEALVRWRHPLKGLIPPDLFIPAAEEMGLIHDLGAQVLATACHDAMQWPDDIQVSVNISPRQLSRGDLPASIAAALTESGLPPHRLEIEITESALLQQYEQHLPAIERLRSLGMSIALDDFGTGYSAMSQLASFPFDTIKIDRSFTAKVCDQASSLAIVKSILYLAREFGVATTAEGVETEEQQRLLATAGVDMLQGYYFARPKPAPLLTFGSFQPVAGLHVEAEAKRSVA